MKKILSTLALLLCFTLTAQAMTPQEAVNAFAAIPALGHSTAGVAVIDLDSGKIVASNNLELACMTASTMKTVTSAVALGMLGADYRFETPVELVGSINDGVFRGDIVITGTGDPTLGSRHFPRHPDIVDEIVKALLDKGIRLVEGRVVVDNSFYPFPGYNGNWENEDLAWTYGAGVHAINYADNEVLVRYTLNGAGAVTSYSFSPSVPGLQVINRANMHAGRSSFDARLEYGTPAVVVMGEQRAGSNARTLSNPLPDSMLMASVKRAIKRGGIEMVTTGRAAEKGSAHSLLLTHQSPELSAIVRSLLDRSDNMFAHALYKALAVRSQGRTPGRGVMGANIDSQAADAIQRWLTKRGVDAGALYQWDGSGLARGNKASPHFFVDMLARLNNYNYGDSTNAVYLRDLMPTANGRVGTFLAGTPLAKQIVLKSGSMNAVQCFVGYYPASQPRYAFAVLVNTFDCNRPTLKNHIGHLLYNLFNEK